jgi:hypothetical protein
MSYATCVFASLLHFSLMHHIMLLLAHMCSYTLDHAELKLVEPMEQAQVE